MIHEWGSSPMIFTSDVVTSENHWITASGQNIVIHGKPYIVLFFACYFRYWTHKPDEN